MTPPARLPHALSAAALGGALCAAVALLAPEAPGVALSGAERASVALGAAGVGAALGALAGLAARPDRWGVRAAGLLPAAALLALAHLPRTGRVLLRVDRWWLVGLAGVAVVLALTARRWPRPVSLCLLGAGLAGLAPWWRPGGAPPPGPAVLVVTLDTARADALALDTAPPPALAPLVARGRVYTEAFAPVALTGPAHAALWSGGTSVLEAVSVNGAVVPPETPWLPERLSAAGWQTLAATSAAVLDADLGFCRGFDRCDTTPAGRLLRGSPLLSWWGRRSTAGMAFRRPDAETVDRALALWADRAAGATLLWVHLYGMHWPYDPSPAARAAAGIPLDAALPDRGLPGLAQGDWSPEERALGAALYRAQVSDLAAQIARLVAALPPDAAVALVGDHGEGLGSHGEPFGHGRLPFAPTARVPLLLAGPRVEPGVDAALVGLEDLATWLEGGPLLRSGPQLTRTWGRSQAEGALDLGALAGVAARGPDRTVAASRWHGLAAYDRAADPLEERPLPVPADDPLRAAVLAAVAAARPADGPSPDQDAMLEALGYQSLSPAAPPTPAP